MARYRVTVDLTARETWVVDASSAREAMAVYQYGTLVESKFVSTEPMFADIKDD